MNFKKRINGSWTDIPHYIHNTSTDTLTTLPADLYADGNNATVGISGNTVQSGTPTPQNPIQPSECGERTGNLCPPINSVYGWVKGYRYPINGSYVSDNSQYEWLSPFFKLSDFGTSFTISADKSLAPNSMTVYYYNGETFMASQSSTNYNGSVFDNIPNGATLFCFAIRAVAKNESAQIASGWRVWVNAGSTALPYEPYGYKIPILSANTTTPVYLGEVETTRKIGKYVFTGEENFFTDGSALYNNTLYFGTRTTFAIFGSNRGSLNSHFYTAPKGNNPQELKYECSGFNPLQSYSDFYYMRINLDRIGSPSASGDAATTAFKTWLAAQYAAGTPVTVWYILATPTTGIVNEPLRKIGDYADAVSGITIPTITGADSFDVLTTLKPSEVSLSYTGWHDATVEEKSENLFDYTTVTFEKYISASGEEATSSGTGEQSLNHSDYIPVNAGMTYTFKCDKSLIESATFNAFCWFDSNKQFIKRATFDVGAVDPYILGTATAPTGTAYLIMNYRGLHGDTAMLNSGSIALPYEPYWK